MAKTKTPLLSLGSRGSIGGALTTQKRGSSTVVRAKPLPSNPRSLPQTYQRWLYEDYAYLWTLQSGATKQIYATAGNRFHLTGFQYWMKYNLTNMPDIAAWWKLDHLSAGLALDSSPNARHLTSIGPSPTTGSINGAMLFDGVNDWMRANASPYLPAVDLFTMEFFLHILNWAGGDSIIERYTGAQRSYQFQLSALNILRLDVYRATVQFSVFTPAIIQPATTYHVAARKNATDVQLLINGVQTQAPTALVGDMDYFPHNISMGSALLGGGWFLDGWLDNFIIYTRALDDTEILRHSQRRYPL